MITFTLTEENKGKKKYFPRYTYETAYRFHHWMKG